ncbi:glycosyltransferase family A protein [Herbiconiux sp. VKM Ac-2851]|uniref:glycosyltransferase family 2 protein n=1 Tax=Herbiconiux sp. VKM Ac-2851 TaxID=2739025 RepID=UPI001563584F|nr:glycosyltransferase family A protein [Herbiconiux sp. VKM Ac-2851]NQX36763.1 glycosyltransferase family 2 protein [Herbiconiux sp. VKM Ac-2851]
MPKLSVVIPAFDNAAYIAEAVGSVLAQRHDDFELIVADHSSTDGTLEAVRAFEADARLTVLSTPAGGGAEANWRRVSEAASGEYLKLLPGDDLLYPGALEAHSEALDAHPSVVLVSSPRDIVDARGKVTIRNRGLQGVRRAVQPGAEAIRQTVRKGTNVFGEPGCVTMRRAELEAAGGWDARFPYLIDQTSYSKVLLRGDYLPVDRTLAVFRVNDTQWSVALVDEQSTQAKAYHAWCREQAPDVISAADVRLGDRRAELMALARRGYYALNARRMRAAR